MSGISSILLLIQTLISTPLSELQGAMTSVASQSSDNTSNAGLMGSTCSDRYFRLHSTYPPPAVSGKQQEERGEVLGSLYMKTVPTAVVCVSNSTENNLLGDDEVEMENDEDDVWAKMDGADDSEDELIDDARAKPKRKHKDSKDRA